MIWLKVKMALYSSAGTLFESTRFPGTLEGQGTFHLDPFSKGVQLNNVHASLWLSVQALPIGVNSPCRFNMFGAPSPDCNIHLVLVKVYRDNYFFVQEKLEQYVRNVDFLRGIDMKRRRFQGQLVAHWIGHWLWGSSGAASWLYKGSQW